jgi:hypothetical protein
MKILLNLLLIAPLMGFGQHATKTSFSFEKGATILMSEETEDWEINLVHTEAPKPGITGLRAELLQKKMEIMERYPKNSNATGRSSAGPAPYLGTNFEGNNFQGVPNDNDMAISNYGVIVSVTNRRIHMYNSITEEELLYRSLPNLASPLGISGSKFDPKVIYDPNNDRFVMIFINGFTWETSQIILGFSETNDPTGEWNMYALPGNPLDNETWSDYPVVGISGKDLYIGINTFTNGSANNSGFTETCLWQVGLKEGYIGFNLISNYYSNVLPQNRPIFNITPMQAAAESDSEKMYLLSNRNTDIQNDSIFLLEITGRASDTTAQLIVSTIQADQPYVLPVPAQQANNQWFDTNDSRILGGYVRNNQINFVQSCTDPSTGTSAIYHGVIDDVSTSPTITTRIYSNPDLNYGYPNISWSGLSDGDYQSIISFNHSSVSEFAGFSALHVNAGLEASDRIEIKQGLSWVNVMTDTLERWGDYSGSQRLYSEPGTVWAVGSFGNQNNGHGTWIAELKSPDIQTGVASIEIDVLSTTVFPNPFAEMIDIEFELAESQILKLELLDLEGKLVKVLLEDKIKAGKNRISFNGSFLSPGTYLMNASSNQTILFSKKVIKQ